MTAAHPALRLWLTLLIGAASVREMLLTSSGKLQLQSRGDYITLRNFLHMQRKTKELWILFVNNNEPFLVNWTGGKCNNPIENRNKVLKINMTKQIVKAVQSSGLNNLDLSLLITICSLISPSSHSSSATDATRLDGRSSSCIKHEAAAETPNPLLSVELAWGCCSTRAPSLSSFGPRGVAEVRWLSLHCITSSVFFTSLCIRTKGGGSWCPRCRSCIRSRCFDLAFRLSLSEY